MLDVADPCLPLAVASLLTISVVGTNRVISASLLRSTGLASIVVVAGVDAFELEDAGGGGGGGCDCAALAEIDVVFGF